jgi:protein TonB
MNHSRADVDGNRGQMPSGDPGRHDLLLVARHGDPSQSVATDLSNVVPFARRRAVEAEFPLAPIAAADRPALPPPDFGVGWRIALLAGSLMLHSLLLAIFWREPAPLASIGIESISVEITLGATNAAGLAPQPGEQEVKPVTTTEEQTPDERKTEESRVATVMPQEVPVAAQEAAPEAIPQEPRQHVQKKHVAAVPNDSAGGIGRGRSDVSSNYNGLVAAHLQRYKQYPTTARTARSQGAATVSFRVDAFGRVTSVELAQPSGISAFDQEAVAMVRRASPFPRRPDGRGRDFTVPVRFNRR